MYLDETFVVVALSICPQNPNVVLVTLENEHGDTFEAKSGRENIPKILDRVEFKVLPK